MWREQDPARQPGRPVAERLSRTDGAPERRIEAPNTIRIKAAWKLWRDVAARRRHCSNYSTPQKFVHLVGCRDRQGRPGLEARQYSIGSNGKPKALIPGWDPGFWLGGLSE